MMRFTKFFTTALLISILLGACGGGGGGGGFIPPPSVSGTIKTAISDPPSCKATLEHAWVTVADVMANLNPGAGPGDGGFVDLTPGLSSAPKQIDLLSAPDTECLLATLGDTSGLQPGTYRQIRIILVANDASGVTLSTNGGTNECASEGGFNCVVDSSGNGHLLTLPSEATTGIKIPPGQLGGGGLTVMAGQGLDIDIDFNACTSVVQAGHSGKFLLKPTLRAAELGTNPLIAGNVVVGSVSGTSVTVPASPQPVPNAVVWLEQQFSTVPISGSAGSDTVENFIGSTLTDGSGNFEFCPVAEGTYDIVIDAASLPGAGSSNATVSTGVSVSSSGGPNNLVIPLVAETGGPGTVNAAFTTANSAAVSGDDITFTGLQPFSSGGATVQAMVPFFTVGGAASTAPAVTTTAVAAASGCALPPASCSGDIHCACVTYTIPNSNLVVGAANSSGAGYSIGTASPVPGSVDAMASQQGTSTPTCSPSQLDSPSFALLAAPAISDAGTVGFTGCD